MWCLSSEEQPQVGSVCMCLFSRRCVFAAGRETLLYRGSLLNIYTLCYGSSLDWIDLIRPPHSFTRGESGWAAAVHLNPSDHVSVQV